MASGGGVDTGYFCLTIWLWVGYGSLAVRPRARIKHGLSTRGQSPWLALATWTLGTLNGEHVLLLSVTLALALSGVKVKDEGNGDFLCSGEG